MLTNINTIASDTYRKTLDFTIKTGGNLLVFGLAGTGKTEIALQAIKEADYEPVYLNLSVLEYPDLVGLQTISIDPLSGRKVVEYAAPKFLPLAPHNPSSNNRKKIIILDEVDKAKNELQNPLLELLQFHTMNGAPIDVQAFILTGNLPDEGAFSRPVSHALTNRCMVYRLEHDFATWHKWALHNHVNTLVLGFLDKNSEMLCQPPNVEDPTAYCRPSPRSWSMASSDLNKTGKDTSLEFQTMLVAGRVGLEAALRFRVWLDHYRHIEPMLHDLIFKGVHPDVHDTEDRLIVCALSACSLVSPKWRSSKDPSFEFIAQILRETENVYNWILTLSPDVQIAAIKSTVIMEHVSKFKLMDSPSFNSAIKTINKMLDI